MTWLLLASGFLTLFKGLAVSLACGKAIGSSVDDSGLLFLLAIAFHLIAAAFLFSAGIAWGAP